MHSILNFLSRKFLDTPLHRSVLRRRAFDVCTLARESVGKRRRPTCVRARQPAQIIAEHACIHDQRTRSQMFASAERDGELKRADAFTHFRPSNHSRHTQSEKKQARIIWLHPGWIILRYCCIPYPTTVRTWNCFWWRRVCCSHGWIKVIKECSDCSAEQAAQTLAPLRKQDIARHRSVKDEWSKGQDDPGPT